MSQESTITAQGPETPVQQPTPAPQPTNEPTPQQVNRQQVYEKYYSTQPPQVEQPANEPAAQPAPEPAPVAPAPSPADERLAALQQQIEQMNLAIQQALPKPPPPPAPQPADKDWIKALAEGRLQDADTAMRALIKEATEAQISTVKPQTVEEAVGLYRIEQELTNFANDIRSKNPELAPFERYISSAMSAKLENLSNSGEIKDPISYAAAYKRVLAEEVDEARKLLQSMRAAGK
jgi:hypothetical protein